MAMLIMIRSSDVRASPSRVDVMMVLIFCGYRKNCMNTSIGIAVTTADKAVRLKTSAKVKTLVKTMTTRHAIGRRHDNDFCMVWMLNSA